MSTWASTFQAGKIATAVGLVMLMVGSATLAQARPDRPNRPDTEARQGDHEAKQKYDAVMADPARTVGFLDKTIRHGAVDRAYRIWVPLDYDAAKTYPILVYLHGHSGRGVYGERLMKSALPQHIDRTHGQFDWIVAFPQALPRDGWSKNQRELAAEVLDRTSKDYAVDEQRVYLVGEGEGAAAALTLAAEEPKRFAAMIALFGAEPDVAKKITHLPIWLWQARSDDGGVRWRMQQAFIQIARSDNIEPRYTETRAEPDEAMAEVFGDEALNWLHAHTLAMLGKQTPVAPVVDAPHWDDRPLATWFRLDRQDRPVFPPIELPMSFNRIKIELRGERYAGAMEQLQLMIDTGRVKSEDADLATKLMKDLTTYRQTLSVATDDYVKSRNYTPAMVAQETLAKQFKGQPQAKAATETLANWKKDPAVQNEITARALYNRGTEYERAGKIKEAAMLYGEAAKRYPDTWGGQRAKRRIDELKARGNP